MASATFPSSRRVLTATSDLSSPTPLTETGWPATRRYFCLVVSLEPTCRMWLSAILQSRCSSSRRTLPAPWWMICLSQCKSRTNLWLFNQGSPHYKCRTQLLTTFFAAFKRRTRLFLTTTSSLQSPLSSSTFQSSRTHWWVTPTSSSWQVNSSSKWL